MSKECWQCEEREYRKNRWTPFDTETKLAGLLFLVIFAILILGWNNHEKSIAYVSRVFAFPFGALSCLFVIGFVRTYAIGWFRTEFNDVDGVKHGHAGRPKHHHGSYRDHQDRPIPGAIYQHPEGGWLRRPKILQQTGKEGLDAFWTVMKYDRDHVLLLDQHGAGALVHVDNVLEVLNQPRSVLRAFRDADESSKRALELQIELEKTKVELETVKLQRDRLGRGAQATRQWLMKVKVDRISPQKSQVGQKARELLEMTEERSGVDVRTIISWQAAAPDVLEGLEISLKERNTVPTEMKHLHI